MMELKIAILKIALIITLCGSSYIGIDYQYFLDEYEVKPTAEDKTTVLLAKLVTVVCALLLIML